MPALAIFYKKQLSIFGNLGDCCGREGFITGSIELTYTKANRLSHLKKEKQLSLSLP
jgi:hypothetical protein